MRQLPSPPNNKRVNGESKMSYTDPSRTILTWNEFGNTVANKISELSLSPIYTTKELELRLLLMQTELLDMFNTYLYLMMTKGINFAVEYMNKLSPEYHYASEWTPADATLLEQLLQGCHEYLTKWTDDIQTKVAKEIDIGIKEGEGLTQIGQRVQETLNTSKARGVLIARTELMRAFNKAAEKRYENAGFKFKTNKHAPLHPLCRCVEVPQADGSVIWVTARDPQVCEDCDALDGTEI